MVSYDLSIKVNDSVLKLIKKSSSIIIKETNGKLVLNGSKDTFYCVVLNEDSFYAESGISLIIDNSNVDLSFLETGDILRISKYVLNIEKATSKEEITMLTSVIKDYSGEVKEFYARNKYDNRLLMLCLKALSSNTPGGIDNVRFSGTDVYINSLFTLIKIEGNSWQADISVPYKLLLSGLSDGMIYNSDDGNTIILNTDVVNYFGASSTTDIYEPKEEFKTLYSNIEFSSENKNILSIMQSKEFTESRIIIVNSVPELQLKSDTMVVNPSLKYDKAVLLSSIQVSILLKIFNKVKFNVEVNNTNNIIRFRSSNQKNTVSMYCAGRVV